MNQHSSITFSITSNIVKKMSIAEMRRVAPRLTSMISQAALQQFNGNATAQQTNSPVGPRMNLPSWAAVHQGYSLAADHDAQTAILRQRLHASSVARPVRRWVSSPIGVVLEDNFLIWVSAQNISGVVQSQLRQVALPVNPPAAMQNTRSMSSMSDQGSVIGEPPQKRQRQDSSPRNPRSTKSSTSRSPSTTTINTHVPFRPFRPIIPNIIPHPRGRYAPRCTTNARKQVHDSVIAQHNLNFSNKSCDVAVPDDPQDVFRGMTDQGWRNVLDEAYGIFREGQDDEGEEVNA